MTSHPKPISPTQVAACAKCGRGIPESQSESWCIGCGTPLGEEIAKLLPRLVAIRESAAREAAAIRPVEPESRGERIFRGMVGMGTIFGLVGAAAIGIMSVASLVKGFDRDDMDFMLVAPFGAFGIAFGLGMFYAGILAVVARGRPFREVSIPRVAMAGAAAGLIPAAFLLSTEGGRSGPELMNSLMLFPPMSAAIATLTLLVARRGKAEITEPTDSGL